MLLTVSNSKDLATDYLILKLKEESIPFVRLNTNHYNKEYKINLFLDGESYNFEIIFKDGKKIAREDIKAVYFRQPRLPELEALIDDKDLEFAKREISEIFRSLWRFIKKDKWLNHPENLWSATNKPKQLRLAADIGFKIPNTCITTSKKKIKDFFIENDYNVIGKAVRHGFYPQDDEVIVANTQKLSRDYPEKVDEYAPVPMIFQEHIKKEFDVRVTVVGNRVFSTAIYSQEHPETSIDWRVWDKLDIDLKHESIRLPNSIRKKCLKITEQFNLNYAAIDLIKNLNNEYIFLELNPNGQWAWIEQMTGEPIRKEIIKVLGV